jgi:drug/metabolite transporter (DMT)-like permease
VYFAVWQAAPVAVLLSLASAMAYGLSDFLGGVYAKRVGPWAIAFVGAVTAAVLVAGFSGLTQGDPGSADFGWSAVAGLGNGLGTAALYRGLSSGRMGVVAPVSGVGAAVVPVLVGLAAGERPGLVVWGGIVVAMPAIWLVASEPTNLDGTAATDHRSGLLDGILAGLGFGVLFAALGQIPEEAGFLPLATNSVVAAAVIAVVATATRSPWVPRGRASYGGAVCGALGALATGFFLVATQDGYLTVTAVIASLYPAFTVLLAFGVLREHVHRAQAIGLALCAVAVGLVAGG